MAWTLAPALKQLMAEVNARWPNRDRTTDGTIGDYKHSLTTSEHNPYDEYGKKDPDGVVRAVDIDKDGIHVPTLLNATIGDSRVHYVIYNKIIYSCHYGWRARPYHGEDPHTGHIHISLRNNTSEHCDPALVLTAQKNTRPWLTGTAGRTETDIWETPMDKQNKEELAQIIDFKVWRTYIPDCGYFDEVVKDLAVRVKELSEDLADVRRGGPDPEYTPVNQELADTKSGVRALAAKVDALESKVDALESKLDTILKVLGNADAR